MQKGTRQNPTFVTRTQHIRNKEKFPSDGKDYLKKKPNGGHFSSSLGVHKKAGLSPLMTSLQHHIENPS